MLPLQGNCSTPIPETLTLTLADAAPLQTLKTGQCLVISDWSVFGVAGTRVWLEGLYIRMAESRPGAGVPIPELIPVGDSAGQATSEVYMSNVSLQGNGGQQECEWCGLRANNATVYAEGVLLCHLSEFGDFVFITRLYFGDFPCHLPFGCKDNDTEGVPVHFY